MSSEIQTRRTWPPWLKTAVIGRHPRRTLWRVLGLVCVCVVVFRFILLPVRVEGESMWPTYHNKRVNFINRLAYVRHEPRRGDVVGIQLAGRRVMFMKRIVGLPGETVEFHRGRLYINGRLLPEPYVRTRCDWELPPEQLGADEYFVAGDNRGMAAWDHALGATTRRRIVGKVLL